MSDTNETLGELIAVVKGPKRRKLSRAEKVTKTEAARPPAPPSKSRRHLTPPARGPPELWRLPKVLAATGLRKTQLLWAVQNGEFPRPVKILADGRANAWLSTEVEDFIMRRVRARDAKLAREP
jgi:predicted DNA-binding transcriptional regulator AlpA